MRYWTKTYEEPSGYVRYTLNRDVSIGVVLYDDGFFSLYNDRYFNVIDIIALQELVKFIGEHYHRPKGL